MTNIGELKLKEVLKNFKIGCEKMPKVLIYAFANLKKSLALVNNKLGKLDDAKKNAIVQACDEIIAGNLMIIFHLRFGKQFRHTKQYEYE